MKNDNLKNSESTVSKNETKKNSATIEVKADWILDVFSESQYADGNGSVSLYTSCVRDAQWMELALSTLNVKFEYQEMIDKNDEFLFEYNFLLGDIEDTCPALYKNLNELNSKLHKFFKAI
ncbi:hypothetical protein [Carboxylicivirga sp. N1Y90]|uniref:hypothetical protein n=1 Tax=Carboxylicivirga fragile TaxID=3417571 RepID=UPI003D33F461|nr:hypothetical protein [Marinilabiliaceae bacterium N1Y90]